MHTYESQGNLETRDMDRDLEDTPGQSFPNVAL